MQMNRLLTAFAVIGGFLTCFAAAQDQAASGEAANSVRFDPPVRLKADDSFIDTAEHVAHAGPLCIDLDNDEKPDLLVGNFRGHLQVYMNTGTRAEPAYESQGLFEADGETVKIPNW